MNEPMSRDFTEFEKRYKDKIKSEFDNFKRSQGKISTQSRQYQDFKKQFIPAHMNFYEKACNFAESIFKIKPDEKEAKLTQESIDGCHLNITPTGVKSFAYFAPLALVLIVAFFTFFIPLLLDPTSDPTGQMFFVVFAFIFGAAMIIPLGKLPDFLANNWRMKASNQMVLSVFYIVTYMRHSSNFENAIDFAAEHLPPPMSLDLKKIIWDVETEKYSTVKESMDAYLESWNKFNPEFVEAIHLIESSLYESSESRRLDSLDKSLNLILEETFEKMLHYAHNLQGPLTMLNMLGIVLPILGLVILPLVVSFMENVKWYHLMAMYNVALPLIVYYIGWTILSTRPTGYGDSDISQHRKEIRKFKNILVNVGNSEVQVNPIFVSMTILFACLFIGFSPLIIHAIAPGFDIVLDNHGEILTIDSVRDCNAKAEYVAVYALIGYRCDAAKELVGPFGLGSSLLSMFIPLGVGISAGYYFRRRSSNVLNIRERAKKLEQEFAGALFQLGNRLGDGLPLEIAFSKVAETMGGTTSGKFFELVSMNITKLGMNPDSAIFDPKNGALNYYPSNIIESSMKVLVESGKKGPLVASQALINVSEYIKQIHRVDERLKDLMADTISSLDSQITFLTPTIAGIVIGITSMITFILGNLAEQMSSLGSSVSPEVAQGSGGAGFGGFDSSFFGLGIPTFYFQFIVGIYVVQIIYIMTIIVNGIRNGADPLAEKFMQGENLIRSTIIYSAIAVTVMIIFNMIAGVILKSMATSGA